MRFSVLLALVPLATALPFDLSSIKSLFVRDLTSDTQNDLINGTPCKEITVIFARGTGSSGNMGTSTGVPFVEAIGALVGVDNVAVQGVAYPASILGFLEGGDNTGAALMANYTALAMTQCPSTNVVVGGYSQGGQLVHKAAAQLSAAVAAKVSSVIIFGDPLNGTAVAQIDPSKVLVICHPTDYICKGTIIVDSEHLDYAENATMAAAFVVKEAGL